VEQMTNEDRLRIAMQVEAFVELLSKRYNLTPEEVADAVRWVRARREMHARVKSTSIVSLIGIVAGATLVALWEGVKSLLMSKGG
jgi:hypothetical protein